MCEIYRENLNHPDVALIRADAKDESVCAADIHSIYVTTYVNISITTQPLNAGGTSESIQSFKCAKMAEDDTPACKRKPENKLTGSPFDFNPHSILIQTPGFPGFFQREVLSFLTDMHGMPDNIPFLPFCNQV